MAADYNRLTVAGQDYKVAWKSVEVGKTDSVFIDRLFAELPNDLSFEENNQSIVPHNNHQGNTILPVTGRAHGETYQIYPVQTKQDSTGVDVKKYAGKLNVISYDPEEIDVVLVAVNGSTVFTEAQRSIIQSKLNEIYKPAVAKINVEIASGELYVPSVNTAVMVDSSESNFYSVYNAELKRIIREAKNMPAYNPDKYYILAVNSFIGGLINGYMPKGRHFGFVANDAHGSTNGLARTIAHELGHGAFWLNHIFDEYPLANGSTDNLMDGGSGTHLHKYQWDLIHNPKEIIGVWSDDDESASILNNRIKSISFFEDIKIQNISRPQWTHISEVFNSDPICYVRNSSVKIKTIINEPNQEFRPMFVKIKIGEQEYIQPLTLQADGSVTNENFLEIESFPSVDYKEEFIIKWYTSIDGEEWLFNIATVHKVFIIFDDPILAPTEVIDGLMQEILYFSCREAREVNTKQDVIDQVWVKFEAKNLWIADFKETTNNGQLTYYSNPFPNASNKWSILNSIPAQGNQYLDGECRAFADIFESALRYHGVSASDAYLASNITDEGFLVNNWDFLSNSRPLTERYPYVNAAFSIERQGYNASSTIGEELEPVIFHQPDIRRENFLYEWNESLTSTNVIDSNGSPAQGTLNPYSDFSNHRIVKVGGKYFDSSYGKKYDSLKNWEENSISGFFIETQFEIDGEIFFYLYIRKNTLEETTITDVH